MFNSTRLAQLLKPLKRPFQKFVDQSNSDKHTKHFNQWQQLTVMIYAQFTGMSSLRQLISHFNQNDRYHFHLGISKHIKRSTLAEANQYKSITPFVQLAQSLMQQLNRRQHKELKQLTYLIDSSPIQLLGRGFDWVKQGSRVKGLKLHLQLELNQLQPVYFELTDANISDLKVGKEIVQEQGATYVMDRGYYDYAWWLELHNKGITLITRPKSNARLTVVADFSSEINPISPVFQDQIVSFTNKQTQEPKLNQMQLRRIRVAVDNKSKPLTIITNDFQRSAQAIAELYKQRWQIELFFKWIKSRLKIKCFWGQNKNSVQIQLLTALISYLLVKLESKTRHLMDACLKTQTQNMSLGEFWSWNANMLLSRPKSLEYYWQNKLAQERYDKLQFCIPGLEVSK